MSISTTKYRVLLILLLFLAAGLRIYALGAPDELMFDETHYVPSAQTMAGTKPHPGMGAWASHELIGRSPDTNFSHPPLGKLIIAAGILAFGDHTFGWRITSALAGVLSIFILVLIGRGLGLTPAGQLLCGWLVAVDGLHISITRLAMLDGFLFLFSVMAVHGVLKYRKSQNPWSVVYIAASLGAALSVKESALNVVAAVMLLLVLFGPETESLKRRLLIASAVGVGGLAFYGMSGFYYVKNGFSPIEWVQFRAQVITKLVNPLADHRYGSKPWLWLFGQKPVWIYWHEANNVVTGIVAIGNLVFWWLFLPISLLFLSSVKRTSSIFHQIKNADVQNMIVLHGEDDAGAGLCPQFRVLRRFTSSRVENYRETTRNLGAA